MLAEAPCNENPSVKSVIAPSDWQLSGNFTEEGGGAPKVETSANQNHGRDADFPRMQACRKILGEAKEVFLNNSYVKNKFFLLSLATDPGYHRRGAGSMLCKWGMAKARKEGLTVTLLTSGMGKFLYEKLGFKEGGMAHVQVDGKEEASDKPTMAASIR